jgi:hypothetical protein
MRDMREPIDLHGLQCVVRLPSSIYSLEAHENLPHERFAHNVFRKGVEAMHSKGMPEAFIVDFSSSSDFPAWAYELESQALTPHRPNDWARSQAALARRAMIASRVSSLAAESETNAATARCVPLGSVMIPISLVAEDDWLAPASLSSPHN